MHNIVSTQTPYRISLGGGGTDQPFYSRERGGSLISAAINQYVKVIIAKRPLDKQILVQTTEVQFADKLDDLDHIIIRETLRYFNILNSIQIATFTTIPTGIGLGSSSTLIVGIIKAISIYQGINMSPLEIAEKAYHIEREIIGLEGGVQDQYIASLGGIQKIDIDIDGNVNTSPIKIGRNVANLLENSLILVFAGNQRNSSDIIRSQNKEKEKMISVYDRIKEIGYESLEYLVSGNIQMLGQLMDEHWELKRSLSEKISNSFIDDLYIRLKNIGSPGGKIIGAGGGGFFMMAVPKNMEHYKKNLKKMNCYILPWNFEFFGTHSLY